MSFMNEVYINIEKEVFRGNVLDIGFDNYGVVYELLRKYDDNIDVEYLEEYEGKHNIEKEQYDNCIMFFALKDIIGKRGKRELLEDVYKFLKPNGVLHIWDIDKGLGKTFHSNVKLSLPGEKIKEFKIIDLNLFKDNSKESIITLLGEYFEVQESKCSDNIYLIRCIKKGRKTNEGITDSC